MTLIDFLRLIARHFKLIACTGIFAAATVFFATRNEKKAYSSHTLINTGLVSGYNIERSKGGRVDYAFTNNELENLISIASSHETMKDLGTQLLSTYLMLKQPDSALIYPSNYRLLQDEIGWDFWLDITDFESFENTLKNVEYYRDKKELNPINQIIFSNHEYFGIEQLGTIQINRERNSDMIRFRYTTTDPGVCQQTLLLLTKIFVGKQKNIKQGQSSDVLAFFERATAQSAGVLKDKEDELLQFMVRNKIINYYEQTRYIAANKEELDKMFFKEQMELAGADSALNRVKKELGDRFEMPKLNADLMTKRRELSNLSAKIARFESLAHDSLEVPNPELATLKEKVKNLKGEMRTTAEATFAVQRTPEGAELKNLLKEWLDQLLQSEQSAARLQVFRQRKKEFDETYQKFAPWGSKLKRIEREIDVAERAYLENLHSYNQARLHQHNMMMSTNLKVVDAPFLPAKPLSSKRLILLVVAFMVGIMLPLGALLSLELLDATLKSPVNASSTIGLDVLSSFPIFPEKKRENTALDFEEIHKKSFYQLYQNIKLALHKLPTSNDPKRLTIFSTRKGEGKSFIASELVHLLREAGERVLFLQAKEEGNDSSIIHPDDQSYRVDHTFFEKKSEADLLNHLDIEPADFGFIILEIPELLAGSYPVDLVGQSDLSLLVTRANRVWNTADSKALERFSGGVNQAPKLIVNAVRPEALEQTLGELPKQRSRFRVWLKNVLNKDFLGKAKLKLFASYA